MLEKYRRGRKHKLITHMSLYKTARSLLALQRNELVYPGWSTSWTVAAINAAISSDGSSEFYNKTIVR